MQRALALTIGTFTLLRLKMQAIKDGLSPSYVWQEPDVQEYAVSLKTRIEQCWNLTGPYWHQCRPWERPLVLEVCKQLLPTARVLSVEGWATGLLIVRAASAEPMAVFRTYENTKVLS